ncbi:TonB-dependent receptor plug domain-containing protein, partial [Arachidicoccus sp.]|uniref:TonB-dependent receptor plug domain-containing protein n=1 Tax=Arachidicoccus sp. TaxID=1872624 RepID=UPI003D216099
TARRTYADLFLKLSNNKDINNNKLYFYDINLKANYQLNNKSQLFASGYFGKDKLGFGNQFGIDWGNQTGTLRWNYIVSPKVFSNTSFIYSNYKYNILLINDKTVFHIQSSIKDVNLKQDFEWHSNNKSNWHFGVNTIYHDIAPTRFIGGNDTANYTQKKETRFSWENALYINNTAQINSFININYGLRFSAYSLLGAGNYNLYRSGQPVGTTSLVKGQIGKTYFNMEPRISTSFLLNKNNSLKFAYARNTQNLHLLSNSASTNPTDQWIGDSYNIKPEISDQASVGIYRDLRDHHYELSVETYYKWMQNQIDYRNGANLSTSEDVESQLLFGKGRAYGIEFYLKKKYGRLTGWLSYTLSRTEKKIDGINDNQWYNATQDQTHNIALVGIYKLSDRWNLSGNFVFYTGNAITFPSGKYSIDNETVFYYTQRNGYRMPDYNRLDLSATYTRKKRKHFESSWVFSVYNVYGRENAYAIKFQVDPNDASKTQAVQTSLFRWVPSVTYNFKF